MPTAQQQFGRRLSGNEAEITYTVFDALTDTEARAALLAEAPPNYNGLPRDEQACEVEAIRGLDHIWIGNARYAKKTSNAGEGPTFRFETRGGTQRVTQALGSTRYPNNAPNSGGAINATATSVEGTDITVPIYTFSETHELDDGLVNNYYKGVLVTLTGRVNDAPFKGLAAGECLFLGAAGSLTDGPGSDTWSIDYAFAGSPNVTGLAVGDITGIAKKGWEYLWARYQTAEDTAAKLLVQKPIAVYVDQVYREGNFAALGIGT